MRPPMKGNIMPNTTKSAALFILDVIAEIAPSLMFLVLFFFTV